MGEKLVLCALCSEREPEGAGGVPMELEPTGSIIYIEAGDSSPLHQG